ncbi:MAG: Asp-tRNA(Asn)/Glu-tRNA(Gln) amidotransferase GatCAB subunit C [Candidatus Nealsonbacteria bacterium CG_4_10_14_0_2_um_filter_37_10]|uniref:Aspartyl/glutamyl-tRNA(Asn/Gln) amidotransferase subunit C n=3 Tax=Candidatus Nealsoniibacteriota TaxID=1817911 RepID=A0A2H0TK07_9BACT|nr:MAG: Asp-tRNA(Asn)/Glu-tRNA(Gln) amidotransferase GatCAB subunit C [Candidatus Nealsonbacteria bacterium CG10_big_fil_rev_8_21_14_0_10_37_25]PIZ89691.1 MAG: Asp-tRNA(Asn)/Glu-tRNA(Gln) amidotransferase GatCAB subunit C [Candidatus Nealsonbacteria bacterium CG_4_10_14_0_2_um_filter_37_10]PJA84503.1 MAG: Asp-tRNA(Asn)/Glu-tRNA(Gln) amidotransferase GatCAB subunit C [Candidatus Nealsonbacteria bacterium CG_4_9_14_3_um_filter_37_13]
MIREKEVKHIAKLARLGLSSKEIEKMKEELSKILDYIEKLKEVDISKTKPTSHSIKVENIMRIDQAEEKKLETRKKLIEMAPEKKEGYLKVKPIL